MCVCVCVCVCLCVCVCVCMCVCACTDILSLGLSSLATPQATPDDIHSSAKTLAHCPCQVTQAGAKDEVDSAVVYSWVVAAASAQL